MHIDTLYKQLTRYIIFKFYPAQDSPWRYLNLDFQGRKQDFAWVGASTGTMSI